MVLCEDSECSVCLLPYSRMDRVPRVLHCRHTFCELCLDTMSQARSGMLHVRCPLCRRVTCVGLGLSLQEALWVDSERWDQIPDGVAAGEDGDEDGCQLRAGEARTQAQQKPSLQAECASSRLSRAKLKLPAFLRRLSLTRQHQERIIPGSNVEMKSWRRLSAEETF
ncbi:E3 ubiquitin-protein ligase SH3RF2 [Salarias fasciatus]|uniref:E3 ubiquitin-protein ligase SH3RF2 n=1 Tax=Salarias fasciatus TaxID=181472 RepID=UPI001176CCD8|nr:E3 ubiquitin-protein ligase SH3RF2-like [Salarias fasciatus]